MKEDKRIQDEEFTEEELNNLYNMRYRDEDKYDKIMGDIKNKVPFEKIVNELHEEKEESHGRTR